MDEQTYQKLKEINLETANEILDTKAIVDCLNAMDMPYPANFLVTFAKNKIKKIFENTELNRGILDIKN